MAIIGTDAIESPHFAAIGLAGTQGPGPLTLVGEDPHFDRISPVGVQVALDPRLEEDPHFVAISPLNANATPLFPGARRIPHYREHALDHTEIRRRILWLANLSISRPV